MAEIIWGLATSHVPPIGLAMDHGLADSPYWKPLFDGYAPARAWMAEHKPDVAVIVYNDHANYVGLDMVPAFALGVADRYEIADEGYGPRPVPPVLGAPELSEHLVRELIDDGFDLTTFARLDVDHGLTVPLSIYCPSPGQEWPCQVVPLLVNVIQYPQPTAARCFALGQALGRAIRSFPDNSKIAVFGTGGMSHQLAGARAGLINPEFDRMFLSLIETAPGRLAALSREELISEAGTEGIELIMWLVMRGALSDNLRRVHETYHVPASNTAAGLALFEEIPLEDRGNRRDLRSRAWGMARRLGLAAGGATAAAGRARGARADADGRQ